MLEYILRHFLPSHIMGAKVKMFDELDHHDRIDVQTGIQRQTCLSDGHRKTDTHTHKQRDLSVRQADRQTDITLQIKLYEELHS